MLARVFGSAFMIRAAGDAVLDKLALLSMSEIASMHDVRLCHVQYEAHVAYTWRLYSALGCVCTVRVVSKVPCGGQLRRKRARHGRPRARRLCRVGETGAVGHIPASGSAQR